MKRSPQYNRGTIFAALLIRATLLGHVHIRKLTSNRVNKPLIEARSRAGARHPDSAANRQRIPKIEGNFEASAGKRKGLPKLPFGLPVLLILCV